MTCERRINYNTRLHRNWRPVLGWQYIAVCSFDFIIAPIFFAIWSYYTKQTFIAWAPLTLQGGGLYHLSMGAIIGVTSYAKSQERIKLPADESEPLEEPTSK